MIHGKIDDVNLEAIERILKRWQGNYCSECIKEPQGMHLQLFLTACEKTLPFDVSNLDLKTAGMDLLHFLCGSY